MNTTSTHTTESQAPAAWWQAFDESEATVVNQYVWGARPGHRDELILRDRVTTPTTSETSSDPPESDERLWSLMDYYDPTSAVTTEGEVVERYRFSAFGLRSILAPDFSLRAVSHYDWDFAFKGQFLDVDTGYYNYGYRYYSPELGRWLSRDPIGERGGTNLYGMAGSDAVNEVDFLGLAWAWGPESVSYFSMAFDPAMRRPSHGPPVLYVPGTSVAEVLASSLGGLNHLLFQHYLYGGGADFDLTGFALIRGEVEAALAARMRRDHQDIIRDVEAFQCPPSGGLLGLTLHSIGDSHYSPIHRVSFTSAIWVIRAATAGLKKRANATILCCNGTAVGASVTSRFTMLFYDQFADAADIPHVIPGAQEFIGGTQFEEIGAWGRSVHQWGLNL